MGVFKNLDVSGSGMSADRTWMEVISNNIANANTTRTPNGGAYQNQSVSFSSVLDNTRARNPGAPVVGAGVQVNAVTNDPRPPVMVYNPSHPDANPQGYVTLPNVNLTGEMVNMISATRSYEANVAAFNAGKQMFQKTFEIGK